MSKPKQVIVGKGEIRDDFNPPLNPNDVHTLYEMPLNARVTSVTVRYVTIPHEEALAELNKDIAADKRHFAAIKANATRKAKKEGAK